MGFLEKRQDPGRSESHTLPNERLGSQNRKEVSDALLDCRVAHTNIATAEKALSQARENWRITALQYYQQVATSSDVLAARFFLTQADTNYYSYIDFKTLKMGRQDWALASLGFLAKKSCA
jgi:hypothetical protein